MLQFIQPSVEIFGIRVDEPVTTLTDLFVSAVCFYAFIRLGRIPLKGKMHLYLRIYFISMAFATAIGGLVGHGFLYAFKYNNFNLPVSPWKLPGWLTSMISIAMIERASIEYARKLIKPKLARFFAWLNIIELLTFMTITFSTLNFFFVEVHTTYGLLIVVASFNIFIYIRTKNEGSKLYLFAVGIAALSALVFMNEWGISKWFTHFDISHTLMTFGAYLFYRASLKAIEEHD
ncbi:MAG: hypothetical protein JXB49_14610 [Bacteroidales bacterium]|nr:hypothetical protein [Bacteroidales bacterium]MBN2820492.1 hypothetical protein [Bacteroidales bacterium]